MRKKVYTVCVKGESRAYYSHGILYTNKSKAEEQLMRDRKNCPLYENDFFIQEFEVEYD